MNDGYEPCGACGQPVDIENDTGFVTTTLGVVVHTRHLPRNESRVSGSTYLLDPENKQVRET